MSYPVSVGIEPSLTNRNRLTTAFRFIRAFTTFVAWFAILLTGNYPQGLYEFGVGALRWRLRVEAYILLMVDEYPPLSLT